MKSWLKAEATPWIIALAGMFGICVGAAIAVTLGLREDGATTLGMICLGIFAGVAAWWRYGKPGFRRGHLRDLARRRRWEYSPPPNQNVLPAQGVPFSIQGRHRTLDVARGTFNGTDIVVMYHRIRHATKDADAIENFTIVAAKVPAVLPVTVASPQRGRHAIAAAIGLPDLNTELADFNQRWRIRATDPRAGHAIIEPRTMERLMQPDAQDFSITWDNNVIMVVERGRRRDFSDLNQTLTVLTDLAALVPTYLKNPTPAQH